MLLESPENESETDYAAVEQCGWATGEAGVNVCFWQRFSRDDSGKPFAGELSYW